MVYSSFFFLPIYEYSFGLWEWKIAALSLFDIIRENRWQVPIGKTKYLDNMQKSGVFQVNVLQLTLSILMVLK